MTPIGVNGNIESCYSPRAYPQDVSREPFYFTSIHIYYIEMEGAAKTFLLFVCFYHIFGMIVLHNWIFSRVQKFQLNIWLIHAFVIQYLTIIWICFHWWTVKDDIHHSRKEKVFSMLYVVFHFSWLVFSSSVYLVNYILESTIVS